jgi:sugar phosphate isomerase/epimerase
MIDTIGDLRNVRHDLEAHRLRLGGLMGRRRFLAGVAGLPFAGSLVAAQAAARVTFGFSLYGMRTLSVDAGLEACAKIGYDAVELALMPGWPAEPQRLAAEDRRRVRRRLTELRLALPALMENVPLDGADAAHRAHLQRLDAAAQLGHDLSPDAPPLIETILGGRPGEWDKRRRTFAQRLGDYANIAEKRRVVVCIKPHRSGAMNLPEQALQLLGDVKSERLQAAYDYSHYEHRDLTLEATLRTLLPRTRFIHVKDCRLDNGRAAFLLPGDGRTDYTAYFRQLRMANWQGSVCVEVSGMLQNQAGYDPLAAAGRSYANLAPAFANAELRRGR